MGCSSVLLVFQHNKKTGRKSILTSFYFFSLANLRHRIVEGFRLAKGADSPKRTIPVSLTARSDEVAMKLTSRALGDVYRLIEQL